MLAEAILGKISQRGHKHDVAVVLGAAMPFDELTQLGEVSL